MRPALPVCVGLCLAIVSFSGLDAQAGVKHHPKARTAASASSSSATSSAPATTASDKNDADTLHVPTIADAPSDDFQRVAWCHGILSGDMQLAEIIDPLEPKDENIQTIGRSYLRAYEAALTLSGQGKTAAGHALAEKARQKGFDEWAQVRKAEIHKMAWTYDNWQLPGDCEHAAVRLSGHPDLFAEMATADETKAINAALNSGGPHAYEELPKPTLKAQNIAPDSDGPVANNTLAVRAQQAAALPAASGSASSSSSTSADYSQGLGQKLGWDKTGG